MKKARLDQLLVEKGLVSSRERARSLVMEGKVLVDGRMIDKAGTPVSLQAVITIKEEVLPFVSRGGLKLKKAIDEFALNVSGTTCLDAGASTGGFTDCLLQEGAKKVYAVDVGYGQLHWKLRQDSRVINLEQVNARYISRKEISEEIDIAVIDVSFISIEKILEPVSALLKEGGKVIALVKPQFQAGRGAAKKGVVRDKEIHKKVIIEVIRRAPEFGLFFIGCTYSPVKGPKGNIEYPVFLLKGGKELYGEISGFEEKVNLVVDEAFLKLN
ncbi:MAG: TlyA family RNA methyltransferase [Firmicutes bacterium]|nr:TlyA family RNA methyltransferase [Bacillota bacterium]